MTMCYIIFTVFTVIIGSLRYDFQLNCYSQDFIEKVINYKGSSRPNIEDKSLGSVHVPHVKGVSEKFRQIGIR
jgi:hypothetical protein